jgi:arginine:pyruvate transaminase
MHYSSLTERINGKGAQAWEVHRSAVKRLRQGDDVLMLSIGDFDFDTPAAIVDTAVDSLRSGRTHYTSVGGEPELRQAIAQRHQQKTGQTVDPDAIVVFPGAQCALFAVMSCLAGVGDEVIILEPMYATYEATAQAGGATMVPVPLDSQNGFRLDAVRLEAAITPRTKAILINSPNNPTGMMLNRDELEAIAQLCQRYDLWLVSDEVYSSLTYETPHLSPVELPGMAERTVVVNSVSKTYAMTGWRLGWAIAPGRLPVHLVNLAQCMFFGLPLFIQDAAITALTQPFAEVETMRQIFRARRDLMDEFIAQMPCLRCVKPQGSLFMFIDVQGTGLSGLEFAQRLLDAGVAVVPGEGFGESVQNYVRLSLGVPTPMLQRAIDRIAGFVQALDLPQLELSTRA